VNKSCYPVPWNSVAEYIAAGSVFGVRLDDTMCNLDFEVIYGGTIAGKYVEVYFAVRCINCAYIRVSRRDDHDEGCGMILEAHLHDRSPLIDAVKSHELGESSGSLVYDCESLSRASYHLEIVGEVSLNIVCERVEVNSSIELLP